MIKPTDSLDANRWKREILPLLDDVAKNFHRCDGLFFTESFILETLNNFQSIEMVIAITAIGCVKRATSLEAFQNARLGPAT